MNISLWGYGDLSYFLNRRQFISWLASLFSFILLGCIDKKGDEYQVSEGHKTAKVYVVRTGDRQNGIEELMGRFDLELQGKRVAIKANYNSADSFPATTHIDTLSKMVQVLKEQGADVVLAERSGMGRTGDVLEAMGVTALARELGFDVVVLDDVGSSDWVLETGTHWKRGFLFPRIFREADLIIQTCCLKTHRYGGHFTMSLKNSVGMVAKYDPGDGYNYMSELHTSRHQRRMIAEINTAYAPRLVIMDGIQGFSTGGPDTGTLIEPGIMLASTDRVALDAVGVSVLRIYNTTKDVSRGGIFEQDQIIRASELGLGASGPQQVEVVPVNTRAEEICAQIEMNLRGSD